MRGYYDGKLSGRRLRHCYEIAPARVQQYLDAEIRFVQDRLWPGDSVLELGCGYGRVCLRLAEVADRVAGIDTAAESLALARQLAGAAARCEFLLMDACRLAFSPGVFDAVACVQNGICAFGVEPETLLRQALRVTRPGGRVLFSTYSDRFWTERLAWFEAQAAAGLLGAIDHERTGHGTIVCQDGFSAGILDSKRFRSLGERLGLTPVITEVDGSSLFCEIAVPVAG